MRNNLMGFFLMLLAVVLGFSLLLPKIHDVHNTTVTAKATKQRYANKQKDLASLKQLAPIFDSNQDKVKGIIATLPQDPQIPDILVSIEKMLSESNVAFTTITPQINAAQQEINMVVAGQAGLTNVEAMFTAISQNNRPMSVSSANIIKIDNTLGFNISVLVPYFSAKTAAPSPAAAASTDVKGGLQ